ncbi:hypothetical protein [Modestobacter lapidis]|nr:hypothetical protein [Modestobacter lapidis]
MRAAALRCALGDLGEAAAAAGKAGVPWDCIDEAVATSGKAGRQKYRAVAGNQEPIASGH